MSTEEFLSKWLTTSVFWENTRLYPNVKMFEEKQLMSINTLRSCSLVLINFNLKVKYRDRLKGLYVVAKNVFLLLLNCSTWPCLGPAYQDLQTFWFPTVLGRMGKKSFSRGTRNMEDVGRLGRKHLMLARAWVVCLPAMLQTWVDLANLRDPASGRLDASSYNQAFAYFGMFVEFNPLLHIASM